MTLRLSNYSIRKQFIVLVMGMGAIITFSSFLYTTYTIANHERESFVADVTMQGKIIADLSISPMVFMDMIGAQENLMMVSAYKEINQVVLFDANGNYFTQYNPRHLPMPVAGQLKTGYDNNIWFSKKPTYSLYVPIIYKHKTLGYLYLQKDASKILFYSLQALSALAIFSFLLMVGVLWLTIALGRIILQPILSLVESTQHVASERNYALRVEYQGNNEVSRLYDALNQLLEETQNLTLDLENRVKIRTNELHESLETLKNAQGQLIESEKMAALGNLVSGVAHEVNTPLGNALTGGSIVLRESKLIQDSLSDGSLKRSVMDEKLGIIIQSATLMIKSLTYAADLVKNFKRISVDQSIDDLRDFDLRAYLETIIQTFHNKLKHEHVEIEVMSDEEVMLYSYPGSFAQLFNNFINNAFLHAFEGMTQGAKITIEIHKLQSHLIIRVSDNGKGVDPKILPNIFEPFVTSKRNAGGTGLGMNIVYNIVTQKLGGTIQVSSEISVGTVFEIHLPYINKKMNGAVNVA
jgi:signal transduction histidine kinase